MRDKVERRTKKRGKAPRKLRPIAYRLVRSSAVASSARREILHQARRVNVVAARERQVIHPVIEHAQATFGSVDRQLKRRHLSSSRRSKSSVRRSRPARRSSTTAPPSAGSKRFMLPRSGSRSSCSPGAHPPLRAADRSNPYAPRSLAIRS
jgi:hypothetical protein